MRAAILVWIVSLCTIASAQGDPADRLEELRAELAAERAALADLEQRADEDLRALHERRATLAAELLTLALENESATSRIAALEDEAMRGERSLQLRVEEMRAVLGAAQTALERLVFASSAVPGAERRAESARADAILLAQARESLADATTLLDRHASDPGFAPDLGTGPLARSLSTYATALDEGGEIELVESTVYVADGSEQTVELLRVGHVAFAYRTPDDRLGLALASPVDASGLRWSEDLDADTRAMLSSAFDALWRGASELTMPLDATGQIRPDALLAQQTLAQRITAGGPLMIPLALVAIAAFLLALERVFTLFVRNRRAHDFALRVLDAAEGSRVDEAAALCKEGIGIVPRTLGACLDRSMQGQAAMEDAIQSQLLYELPTVQRFLRTLAILAAVAPLVGLLGTVTGIIQTFGVIKALGTTDPNLMAGGISVALVTTAVGLSVAIPTMLVQGILKGRGDRLIADAERYAASLLTVLSHGEIPAEDLGRT